MRIAFHAFAKSRRGNAATEFAFILPIMLLLIGGIVEFGRFFVAYNEVNRLASRYAITYADCTDSASDTASKCAIQLQSTFASSSALQNLVPQLNVSSLSIRIFYVSMDTNGQPTYLNVYPTSATFDSPSVTSDPTKTELANARNVMKDLYGNQAGGNAVVTTISYQHQLLFFSQLMSQFIPTSMRTMTSTVAQRQNS